ncbi:MAG: PAS domain-containing protein [Desulfobacteraceae bacterium]|nr:PAS domain-containing protein [Desulfobacteraceae bacterium]
MIEKPTYEELERRIQEYEQAELERSQVENALRDSAVKFRTVADFTYDMEYWLNKEGDLIYISPSCERITGYSTGEFQHNPNLLSSIVHPDDVNLVKKHDYNIVENGEPRSIEFRIIAKNGEERWIGHVCQTVYDNNGVNIGIRGSNRDITDQKGVEGHLEASEKRFREIIEDVSQIAIQGYDEERSVIFWNKASEKIYGYTGQEALGSKIEDLIIPAGMKEEVIRLHRRWVDHGKKIPPGPLTLRDKNGDEVHTYSSHVMHETPHGKEMFCIDVDLNPIRQAEQEREKLIKELQDAIEDVKILSGLLPICSKCKKIRDDKGYWNTLEAYIESHSDVLFSHGMCSECSDELYGNQAWYIKSKKRRSENES